MTESTFTRQDLLNRVNRWLRERDHNPRPLTARQYPRAVCIARQNGLCTEDEILQAHRTRRQGVRS